MQRYWTADNSKVCSKTRNQLFFCCCCCCGEIRSPLDSSLSMNSACDFVLKRCKKKLSMLLAESAFEKCDKNMWHMWNIINSENLRWCYSLAFEWCVCWSERNKHDEKEKGWKPMFHSTQFSAADTFPLAGKLHGWMLAVVVESYWFSSNRAACTRKRKRKHHRNHVCRNFFLLSPMKTLWYSVLFMFPHPGKIVLIKKTFHSFTKRGRKREKLFFFSRVSMEIGWTHELIRCNKSLNWEKTPQGKITDKCWALWCFSIRGKLMIDQLISNVYGRLRFR